MKLPVVYLEYDIFCIKFMSLYLCENFVLLVHILLVTFSNFLFSIHVQTVQY